MKTNFRLNVWAQIITFPFIIIMVVLLIGSMANYDETDANLSKQSVQETVQKYAIQCYASEGSYPPDLEYLAKHYGLILDNDLYIYEYDVFASNIMPDIIIHDNIKGQPQP